MWEGRGRVRVVLDVGVRRAGSRGGAPGCVTESGGRLARGLGCFLGCMQWGNSEGCW